MASPSLFEQFCQFSQELDARNDRSERIVKLSRDITIESKRTICLLQRSQLQGAAEKHKCLEKAEACLGKLRRYNFVKLARELDGESPFYFNRSYTFGLQEYIEAVSFCHYLRKGTLISHGDVQSSLEFHDGCASGKKPTENNANVTESTLEKVEPKKTLRVYVSQHDYLLGLFDLTGELMRVAINANPVEDITFIENTCKFLQLIHQGTSAFYGYRSKEFSRKTSTLMSSVLKLEVLIYNLKIREMDAFGGNITSKPVFVDILDTERGKARHYDDYDSGNE